MSVVTGQSFRTRRAVAAVEAGSLAHAGRPFSSKTQRLSEAGVTLIELMISLVIASIAISATFSLGMSIMNGYREHRDMVKLERTARSSMAFLSKAIRSASPAVPNGDIDDLIGCSDAGGLRVLNRSDGPDEIEVVYPIGGIISSLRQTYDVKTRSLIVVDGSEFQAGDYAVVSNLKRGHLIPILDVKERRDGWYLISKKPSRLCRGVEFPDGGYPPGSVVVRAQISRFFIDDSDQVGGVPTLMMDPDSEGDEPAEPLARGLEDLQVAIGVDLDRDGVVDDQGNRDDEWFYNATGDSDLPQMSEQPPRAYRVTVVARSVEPANKAATGIRPAVEDRAIAEAPDGYRRRVLSATIELRNLTGSP
ncbi:MAG: PilW family protein [Proteobacteria bacterium]|nr:PilW family protein [Pseudomonadota bacterium]